MVYSHGYTSENNLNLLSLFLQEQLDIESQLYTNPEGTASLLVRDQDGQVTLVILFLRLRITRITVLRGG